MKERINRLAKGIIDSQMPEMTWAPEVIEETVRMNATVRRELFIGSSNGLNVKGFVYSSSLRVRIPNDNNTFGGLRNHILYEVDTSFLAAGDEIEGSFYLVTNCGEKEIPYQFHVDLAASGQVLGSLRTAEDFLQIAKNDMDTALRLMEYPDFTQAPFMQDLRVRAIYDGLSGHGSRQNVMEEFLIALGVKEPVRLLIPQEKRVYENPSGRVEDALTLRTEGWGYLYLEAEADGDFLHIPKKSATQEDFADGTFSLPFAILTERLHAGRNFGTILIRTARVSARVPVEVTLRENPRDRGRAAFYTELRGYLEARLEYESGLYEAGVALGRMQKELDLMKMTGEDAFLKLLQAEIYLLTNRRDKACLILDEVRDAVLAGRLEHRKAYCFFQYLQVCIWGDADQRDSLIRLLQKYAADRGAGTGDSFFYVLLLKTDPALSENPETVLISMEQQFEAGCASPFLYMAALKLLEENPQLLDGSGAFELHALYFAARRGLVSEALAVKAAGMLNALKGYRPLCRRLLAELYAHCQNREILTALCAVMIRGDLRGEAWFEWYSRGVSEGVSLTRLYEYFLYSLPESYDQALPQEIFRYFSYAADLDAQSRARLYENLLRYVDPDSEIYRLYERGMEQFAVEQLFAGRVDRRLAVIYRRMIYRELIDPQLARVLPAVLCSVRIACPDRSMRYVVVRREELMREDAYPLTDGIAYVPLFSGREVLLFQDAGGNRYLDVSCEKTPVMEAETKELLKTCFEMDPGHPFLFVNACWEAMEKEKLSDDDAALLEQADRRGSLHPLFRVRVLSAIVRYYRERAEQSEQLRDGSAAYLLCLDKDLLTRAERNGVCETLTRCGYLNEAYEMISRYGAEGIGTETLFRLCTKLVLKNLFDEDDRLLHLSHVVFEAGKSDSVLLDYLCEHFNGTTDQMYRVLLAGIREHVETYDLEERLVAQMLFTGCTQKLDRVFELYASRKKTGENVVRAYFTVKSAQYFLEGKATQDRVFSYLEGAVNGSVEKDRVPDIYLLALTKYYSTLPALNGEQQRLCQTVVDVLIEAGMVFAYFKDLARFIVIPGDILDKEIIEYHGRREARPYLRLRILPGEEEYHYEEMRPVYRGIYIREKVLFEGEIMEYQIEEEEDGARKVKAEGSISCREVVTRAPGNRFACLNEMSLSLDLKNEDALQEKMKEYVKKDAAVAALFTLQ